ncbi:hypothetical protein F7Q99_07425 [Streptomyces kaniharaensis]|uniref:Uncharacterized protein n=1 Tax=Streptomyces kaniharaensis TaxID=212423 RepID=A0A6N7KNV3_9ACTN|nr:hypothetical protein [Streptomyces kaniharaensis]MQS12128.1 hypothetical protein [Streptomyces kaniharaensis]
MSTAVLAGRPASIPFVLPARFERVPVMAAVALLPWLGVLAVCHETPWVVLDLLEFSALLSLDALLRRRSAAARWAGGAVALLLAGDALADIACAGPGHAVLAATVMALCVELPLSAVCLLLGRAAASR